MTRRYDEPVEVRRRDEDPTEFLWRGRLYVVRSVLATWVETGVWWRTPAGAALPVSASAAVAHATSGSSALSVAPAVGDGERQVWRVEASAGRAAGTGVYDLCFRWDDPGQPWVLLRSMD
jgi:Family of unknown function (DUF6504)